MRVRERVRCVREPQHNTQDSRSQHRSGARAQASKAAAARLRRASVLVIAISALLLASLLSSPLLPTSSADLHRAPLQTSLHVQRRPGPAFKQSFGQQLSLIKYLLQHLNLARINSEKMTLSCTCLAPKTPFSSRLPCCSRLPSSLLSALSLLLAFSPSLQPLRPLLIYERQQPN